MANEQNLKSFEKGKSGNPKGRPKGSGIQSKLKSLLEATPAQEMCDTCGIPDTETQNYYELLAASLLRRALNGDHKAFQEISKRTEKIIEASGDAPDSPLADLSKNERMHFTYYEDQ